MIWRCACGHKVARYDAPASGQRPLWCRPCHATMTFTMSAQDQREPKRPRVQWTPPEARAPRRGDYLAAPEDHDDE